MHKYLCLGVVEKLIKAKKLLSERISKSIKDNNNKGIEHIVKVEVDKIYNELFMIEEK